MTRLIGRAENSKEAAILLTEQGTYYIRNLSYWKDEFAGKTIEVSGNIVRSNDAPLVLYDGSGIYAQGIPVYSKEEMQAASGRNWIENLEVIRVIA
jgi:hypothetical protein